MNHPAAPGDAGLDPEDVALLLGLDAHPEGGRYRETWRASSEGAARSPGTAIYFLLTERETSHWHRVDSTEIWHFYAGSPLLLRTAGGDPSSPAEERILGADLAAGHRPQLVVQPGEWQSATSLGRWTLVGCTVAPGFDFAGFELAPAGWEPPGTLRSRDGEQPR